MNQLEKLIRFTKDFDVINSIGEAIINNKDEIVDLNIDQLKREGKNRDGIKISSYAPYSDTNIIIKRAEGTLTNNNASIVNLFDTGDFQEKMFLKEESKGRFTIDSRDFKSDDLKNRYDEEIFGLTDENQEEVINEFILPFIKDQFQSLL